jgi:hypothetical protein
MKMCSLYFLIKIHKCDYNVGKCGYNVGQCGYNHGQSGYNYGNPVFLILFSMVVVFKISDCSEISYSCKTHKLFRFCS